MIAEIENSLGEKERFGVLMIFTVNDDMTYAALIKLNEDDTPMAVDIILRACISNEDDSFDLYELEDKQMHQEAVWAFNAIMDQL